MATTILGPELVAIPVPVSPPIIEIKQNWPDDWQYEPEIELVNATAAASGQDLGSAILRRRYGSIHQAWDETFANHEPWDLTDWWVRISYAGPGGLQTAWIGQISGEGRDVLGGANIAAGSQEWVAYEPLQMLRKTHLSISYWLEPGEPTAKRIGWLPDMNGRDRRGFLVGNRSASAWEGAYCYGGTEIWTHYDYIIYLLTRFMSPELAGGASWTLGGQVEPLKSMAEIIRFGACPTVAEMLRDLIPIKLGVDYTIVPTAAGFEIQVYALGSVERSFGSATLPANPNRIEVYTSTAADAVQCQVARTVDHRYEFIQVIGRRAVVCCSIDTANNTLVPGWSDALETAYKDGTGDPLDSGDLHDEARKADRFRNVYRLYTAAADWDRNNGSASPWIDEQGELAANTRANYQNQVRATLGWTPLKEGFDYSTNPETDHNPADAEPDFLPAAAWVYDIEQARYVLADEKGIGISVIKNNLGVYLGASPAHLLAGGRWSGANASETEPQYDAARIVATLAFESDARLRMGVDLPDGQPGTCLIIEVPDAEFWFLAKNTIVGVDDSGQLLFSGSIDRVLRNDAERLAMFMAGALARYNDARARATLTVKGLLPWTGLIGKILTTIEQGGEQQAIGSPITSVTWQIGSEPVTIVRTGFAQ